MVPESTSGVDIYFEGFIADYQPPMLTNFFIFFILLVIFRFYAR